MPGEADSGAMQLQGTPCQQPPEAGRSQEAFPESLRGSRALPAPGRGLLASRTERLNFSAFKPPTLGSFVTAAPGNQHNKEKQKQRGEVTCPKPHSKRAAELGGRAPERLVQQAGMANPVSPAKALTSEPQGHTRNGAGEWQHQAP